MSPSKAQLLMDFPLHIGCMQIGQKRKGTFMLLTAAMQIRCPNKHIFYCNMVGEVLGMHQLSFYSLISYS